MTIKLPDNWSHESRAIQKIADAAIDALYELIQNDPQFTELVANEVRAINPDSDIFMDEVDETEQTLIDLLSPLVARVLIGKDFTEIG